MYLVLVEISVFLSETPGSDYIQSRVELESYTKQASLRIVFFVHNLTLFELETLFKKHRFLCYSNRWDKKSSVEARKQWLCFNKIPDERCPKKCSMAMNYGGKMGPLPEFMETCNGFGKPFELFLLDSWDTYTYTPYNTSKQM